MHIPASRRELLLIAALLLTTSGIAFAQTAPEKKDEPAKDAATVSQDEEKTVVMSPFTVTTDKDRGYRATNATSGTRLNAPLKDLPMPISVITEQFLRDTGSTDLRQSLRYTAGIVLQSQNDQDRGSYGPGGVNNPEGSTANKTQTSYKIRGYVTDAVLRDGFRRQNSTDSINISRVEVAFGPTALLYGIGSFGGIVNYLPKTPQAKTMTEVAAVYGSYDFMRATIDTTGSLSKTMDFNYRLTGAWQSMHNHTDYFKERHDFISPAISFRPTKTTQVDIDYEYGTQDLSGIGFQRVRAMANVGVNNDQNEHADFYTLPGTDPYSFRWSGPDTYVNSKASNFRAQVAQQILPDLNLLVGYNRAVADYDQLDTNGNLIQNQGPVALRGSALFRSLNPTVGDSNLNVIDGVVNNVILQYQWGKGSSGIVHDQVRAELNYKFKMFPDSTNRWLKMDHSLLLGHSEEKQENTSDSSRTADGLWNYKSPTDKTPIRFGKQGNGSADVSMVHDNAWYNHAWDQATYGVYMGKLLDDRLMLIYGMRDDRSDNFVHWQSFLYNSVSDVRSPKVKTTTHQKGASFQITRHVSVYGLSAEGIQPNFSGARDTTGNPIGPILAKSKEYGLKFDLFDGKISGSVSQFKIKRSGTPLSYWWAPTSNDVRFNPAKDIVYNVSNFTPGSVAGGSNGGNGATDAALSQWNAAISAGAAYQKNGSWYVNASKPTGAAYLDKVFDETKARGMSWPGWLYIYDSETNNSWNDIAAAKGESVIASDETKGWGCELMYTPNNNFQLVANYAHIKKVITSAGHFAKFPSSQDRWAVWYFPNTDWGLTGKPLATVYKDSADTSTWTGIGYGTGERQDDTPDHAVTAWANYQITKGSYKGLSFGLGSSWESPREYQSGITRGGGQRVTDKNGNLVILKTPSRVNVNAMVRYAFKWNDRDSAVQLNIENLMDDRDRYGLIYAAPRNIHLEFNTKF